MFRYWSTVTLNFYRYPWHLHLFKIENNSSKIMIISVWVSGGLLCCQTPCWKHPQKDVDTSLVIQLVSWNKLSLFRIEISKPQPAPNSSSSRKSNVLLCGAEIISIIIDSSILFKKTFWPLCHGWSSTA